MAAAAGDAGKRTAREGGLSPASFLMVVAALTLVAVAAGFLGGTQLLASAGKSAPAQTKGAAAAAVQNISGEHVKVLGPIVTNLGGNAHSWIRLESSLVFPDEVPADADTLAARISEDIVAFLRTLKIEQIQGASGFQLLCDDLNDRVRVRSNGRVRELIVQGLIIE
jgi:flagellar FliL protein